MNRSPWIWELAAGSWELELAPGSWELAQGVIDDLALTKKASVFGNNQKIHGVLLLSNDCKEFASILNIT